MSYLDAPRLHFRGWFQADVSTINNDVRFYQNQSFVPEYQQLNQNGSWNPEGTGIFRVLDCAVTGGFLNGKSLISSADDPVIGLPVLNADQRAPGKLVDLDPQQQMVSQIWGMQMRVADASASQSLFHGEFSPAAFINLWLRQQKASAPNDQQLAACYQSVLDNVKWLDTASSGLLQALQKATQDERLSIAFNLYGYGRDPNIPRYTMGHIVGTIGPYLSGEPRHFVVGRQMIADTPQSFTTPAQGIYTLQAKVAADLSTLTVDFGNSFPIDGANSGLMDIGTVSVAVMNSNPDVLQTSLDSSQFVVIGDVPYTSADWFTQTAGIQSFDLCSNPAAQQFLPTCPLVLLTFDATANNFTVRLQESINGLYVRADDFVFRINPGGTEKVEFYATQFGAPLGNATIQIEGTDGFMGGSGGGATIDPAAHPRAKIPDIRVPAEALTYASSVTTDTNGYASLDLHASTAGPGVPRAYISGQLYGLGYQLAQQPAAYISNQMNYISVLAYSAKTLPDTPTWYQDIQPLFTQYGNLYPIMSRYVVDLKDYTSVCSRLQILKLAFSLPIRDPNHMPVTRDLGEGDRATILKWLGTVDQNGLPYVGSPPVTSASPPQTSDIDQAGLELAPLQSAGKTAVIRQLEERLKPHESGQSGVTP